MFENYGNGAYHWYCEGFNLFFDTAQQLKDHVALLKSQRNMSGLRWKITKRDSFKIINSGVIA